MMTQRAKRSCSIIFLLFLLNLGGLFAQAPSFSLGLGTGVNVNLFGNVNLLGEYRFSNYFSAGLRVLGRIEIQPFFLSEKPEFSKLLYSLEAMAVFRYYPYNIGRFDFFVEADGGGAMVHLNNKTVYTAVGAGVAGTRITFGKFYLEPYIYGGYPTIFGGGLLMGFRIDLKKRKVPFPPEPAIPVLTFPEGHVRLAIPGNADGDLLRIEAPLWKKKTLWEKDALSWRIEVRDQFNAVFATITKLGIAPRYMLWNCRNGREILIPSGHYRVSFIFLDNDGKALRTLYSTLVIE
jgi:hypothetical protein